jgi:predicted amidohydrolase
MLKTAQIQFNPQVGEMEANFNKVQSLLSQTGDSRLVILPELANSGYNFIDRKHALSLAEKIEKSSYVEMLVNTAASQDQFIISGYHEKEGEELFNTSLFITPDGTIGKYRKIHLFMNEKQIFSRGNLGLPTFDLDGHRMGMLICFDYLFPEIWRIMGLKGADLIAHPSNLVTYKAFKVVPAQSVINRFFIFTTNRIGTERDISFSGRSFVTDPEGDVIAEASADKEEVLFTEINPELAKDKMITKKNHVLDDRFPELYGDVIKQSIAEND